MSLICASQARAQRQQRRIGIVVLVEVNVDDATAQDISANIGSVLAAELPVDVIAGAESKRRLPEEGVADNCVAVAECRTSLGRRLDADELLMLAIVKLGSQIQVDTTWANVASGESRSRARIELTVGGDLGKELAGASKTLLPHIKPEQKQKGPDIVVVPIGGDRDSGRRMTLPVWIGVGVTGAAAITGTIFAISARQKYHSLEDDRCRELVCDQSEVDTGERHAIIADVMFGVAIAAGVTTTVLYLTSAPDKTEERAAEPAPALGVFVPDKGGVGVSFGGRF